jgi:hypothetical protein
VKKQQYPVKDFDNNVIYTKDKGAIAWYRINGRTAGLNNTVNIAELKRSLIKLANQLKKFGEIDYKVLPVQVDASKIIDSTISQYKGKHAETGRYYAQRAKAILSEEIGSLIQHHFFIGVHLNDNDKEDEGRFLSDIKKASKVVASSLKQTMAKKKGMNPAIIKHFENSEKEAFSIIGSHLDAERCTEHELRYIIRYQFLRGIHQPTKQIRKYNLTEGVIDPSEYGFLKINQLEGESYVAFLPVSEFPIDMQHTAWSYGFQNFPFPVEMNIKTIYMGKEHDYKETNKLKKRFREQDAELINANEDEDTLVSQGRELLFELENEIRNEKEPIVRTYAYFAVWGSTKQECKDRAKEIKDYYDNWAVVQPLHDQHLLFHQSIPGAKLPSNDWEQPMTPQSFAESLFTLIRKIGNNVGFYLGKDISLDGESKETSRQLVWFNPFAAAQGIRGSKYSSPHCTISGPTGMGKSLLLKYIILNSIFYGAQVLLTDPKNEMQKMLDYSGDTHFRKIVESFNFITFSSDKKDAGKLDPLTFLTGEEALDAALSVLEYLLKLNSEKWGVKTALSKAVREVIAEKEPGLLKVVRNLQKSEEKEIKEAGDYLYELGTQGIAKLLFSDGKVRGIDLHEQINILQIQNLTLPEQGEKPQTRDEHIATALMIPLAKFSAKFSRNAEQMTLTIFEEAWMLSNTGVGSRLIKEMLRTGRSLDSAVYLVTQSITADYNKADIKEQIGTKFAFKAKTSEEAANIIEYLGLEDNEDNRKMLKNLTEGQCVMEDMYGRTAIVTADVLFEEWEKAFNTKAGNKSTMVQLEEAFI